jgi:hypothetical protein
MRIIQSDALGALVSERLRTTSDFISNLEGLAEFGRHVASFECPCSERHLVGSLARYMLDQVSSAEVPALYESYLGKAGTLVSGLLDQGDLIEVEGAENGARLLALRAPAACALSKTRILVLGIVPLGSDSLPSAYQPARQLKGYSRVLTVENSTAGLNDLHAAGYVIISETEWAQLPEQLSARLHVGFYTSRFRTDNSAGHVEGLRVLDSERAVTHYMSRWIGKPARDGDFVARRQKRYGNDSWAYVRLRNLEPASLIDFPTKNFLFRACDEAWHLQHELGRPQRYQVRPDAGGLVDLLFFSPIPQWAQRRLASLGEQVEIPNCLLAFRFPSADVLKAEITFIESRMWLAPL